jgi:hypothetical protein
MGRQPDFGAGRLQASLEPPAVALLRLIGEERLARLLCSRGGERVYVPGRERLTDDHWLVRAVGMEAAGLACDALKGANFELPLGMSGLRNQIRAVLDEALESGLSTNRIVRLTGLSARTVRRRRAAGPKPPERLGPLFRFFE